MKGTKIEWTEDMEKYLRKYFPTKFNTDIAKHLGISLRSVIRKARELGIEKVEDFHQMNAEKIGRKISKVNKGMHNSGSFKKGSEIGKEYRFQKGHQLTEEQMNKKKENSSKNWRRHHTKRSQRKRQESWRNTWLQDCLRFTYGMKTETKFHYRYNALRDYLQKNGSKRENAEP